MVRRIEQANMESTKLRICTGVDQYLLWHGLRIVFGVSWNADNWGNRPYEYRIGTLRQSIGIELGMDTDLLQISFTQMGKSRTTTTISDQHICSMCDDSIFVFSNISRVSLR